MFFYSDGKVPSNSKIDVWKMNGTKAYLKHYDQYLFLQFVTTNPRASEVDKRQARHELTICERKLTYWSKHPNYVHADALKGIQELKQNWQQGVAA